MKARAQKISPARVVALRTLMILETDPETLASEALAAFAEAEKLSRDDVRLARTLIFGVLRHALTLDHLYGRFLTRSANATDPRLRLLLRVGAFQRYYLSRIPDYAIVNETIELGRQVLRLPARNIGFLNALLRKVINDDADMNAALPQGNRVGALSVRFSIPPEITGMLVEKYGTLKAIEIMQACNEEPPMTVRVNTLRATREQLAGLLETQGFRAETGVMGPDAMIITPMPGENPPSLFETDAYHEGLFYAQDEGSQMVAHLALPWAHGRVLDLCSAPGGKTTHLAELTRGSVEIVATDSSCRRLEMVRENIARLRTPNVQVATLEEIPADAAYDLVLVDAPCSGVGTIRRNPEVRYRVCSDTLVHHQERQLEVLETAAKLVSDTGAIVYSTCSVSPQENQGVVARFLKSNPGWQMAATDAEVGHTLQSEKRPGFYGTWPSYPQVDGFEAVVLLRTS